MRFFNTEGKYFITKTEAAKFAREVAKDSYHDIVVTQVEIATTRDNVLRMLNAEGGDTVTVAEVFFAKAKKKGGD